MSRATGIDPIDVTRSTVYRAVDRAAVTEARAVGVTLPLLTAEPTGT